MRRNVLITGATDGLGLSLFRFFSQSGYQVFGLGRRPVDEFPHLSVENYLQVDLAASDLVQRFRQAWEAVGSPSFDIVVHNAGVGYLGDLSEQSEDSLRDLVRVNLTAPILITRILLSDLLDSEGKIVFISSVTTSLPTPSFAAYGASKAALEGFTRSLRVELEGRVEVQVIRPGATRTGMHQKVGMSKAKTRLFASPEKVAKEIFLAIQGKDRVVTVGRMNKLVTLVGPLLKWGPRHFKNPACHNVLITGAADGIGKALTLFYLNQGCRVIGVDRNEESGRALSTRHKKFQFIHADLFQDLRWADTLPTVDLVIHNAGINSTGPFETLESEEQDKVIELNLVVPLLLCAKLLKHRARTVFISSLSYFVSYPGASTYAATKDGLAHLACSLQGDSHTLTVFPGPVRTSHARRHSPDNRREASRMEPNHLARLIGAAHRRGNRMLIPGLSAKGAAILGLVLPRAAEKLMKKVIYERFQPGNKKFKNEGSP